MAGTDCGSTVQESEGKMAREAGRKDVRQERKEGKLGIERNKVARDKWEKRENSAKGMAKRKELKKKKWQQRWKKQKHLCIQNNYLSLSPPPLPDNFVIFWGWWRGGLSLLSCCSLTLIFYIFFNSLPK